MARTEAAEADGKEYFIGLRLDSDAYAAVRAWAHENTGGNMSGAIRQLVAIGLDPKAAVEEEMGDVEGKLERMKADIESTMESYMERMLKANAKGAKASMGSLYLLSKYLQPIAESVQAVGDYVQEHAEEVDGYDGWSDAVSHSYPFEFTRTENLAAAGAEGIYRKAFQIGGRLNAPGAGPSLAAAEKSAAGKGGEAGEGAR